MEELPTGVPERDPLQPAVWGGLPGPGVQVWLQGEITRRLHGRDQANGADRVAGGTHSQPAQGLFLSGQITGRLGAATVLAKPPEAAMAPIGHSSFIHAKHPSALVQQRAR